MIWNIEDGCYLSWDDVDMEDAGSDIIFAIVVYVVWIIGEKWQFYHGMVELVLSVVMVCSIQCFGGRNHGVERMKLCSSLYELMKVLN